MGGVGWGGVGGDVAVIGLRVKANQSVTSESNERETGGNISINEVRARAASIGGKNHQQMD